MTGTREPYGFLEFGLRPNIPAPEPEEPWAHAVQAIAGRARGDRPVAVERLERVLGVDLACRVLALRLRQVGRLTLNFHPDRIAVDGASVAAGLARSGRYRNQWVTWISSGGRSALLGGRRHR